MAPQVGLEPTTLRLTAGCSAIELLRSGSTLASVLDYHRNHSRGRRRLETGRVLVLAQFQDFDSPLVWGTLLLALLALRAKIFQRRERGELAKRAERGTGRTRSALLPLFSGRALGHILSAGFC